MKWYNSNNPHLADQIFLASRFLAHDRVPRVVVQDRDLGLVREKVLRVVVDVGEIRDVAVLGPVRGASHAVARRGQLERLHLKQSL